MQEMVQSCELGFLSKYESMHKENFHADITYVIIERFLSVENELPVKEDFILHFSISQLKELLKVIRKPTAWIVQIRSSEHPPLFIEQKD